MKNLNYIYGFLFCSCLLLLTACTKDGGNYDLKEIDKDFKGDTYAYLKSRPGVFDSLLVVIDRLGLQTTLRDSNITLFALDNQSFRLAINNLNTIRKLSERPPKNLSDVTYRHLDTMMTQYIIRGKYTSDSLQKQDGLKLFGVRYGYPMQASLNKSSSSGYSGGGPAIISLKDTKWSQFVRTWVGTTTSSINIKTSNAVVHVIEPGHIFGFNAFVSRMTFIPPPPNLFTTIGGVFSVQIENHDGPNGIQASKYAFDGNSETKFYLRDFVSVWMQFALNSPAVANVYTITSANDTPNRDPTDWNVQGSNDGVNFTTLDARLGETFDGRALTRVFRMPNTVAYKFYRLNITRIRSGIYMQVADWTMNFAEKD